MMAWQRYHIEYGILGAAMAAAIGFPIFSSDGEFISAARDEFQQLQTIFPVPAERRHY